MLEVREIIYIAFSFSRVTRFKNEKEIFLAFPVRFLRLEQTPKMPLAKRSHSNLFCDITIILSSLNGRFNVAVCA